GRILSRAERGPHTNPGDAERYDQHRPHHHAAASECFDHADLPGVRGITSAARAGPDSSGPHTATTFAERRAVSRPRRRNQAHTERGPHTNPGDAERYDQQRPHHHAATSECFDHADLPWVRGITSASRAGPDSSGPSSASTSAERRAVSRPSRRNQANRAARPNNRPWTSTEPSRARRAGSSSGVARPPAAIAENAAWSPYAAVRSPTPIANAAQTRSVSRNSCDSFCPRAVRSTPVAIVTPITPPTTHSIQASGPPAVR